ncbi:hypothetical protein GCM10010415_20050 [Streptomyces atrovirens]
MAGGVQASCWSGSYGSDGAVAARDGSVRASVTAAISSTGVRAPKLAYQAGRLDFRVWVSVHHCPLGSGPKRRRAFWSGLESRTRGIRGAWPWLQPQARWRGTVIQAGSPPPARWRGVMKSTSTVSAPEGMVTAS